MFSSRLIVYLITLLAMLIWGLSFVWVKNIFEFLSPSTTVFLRILLSSFFLLTITLIAGKFQIPKRKDILFLLVVGILDPFAYFLLEGQGLKFTDASVASVIISLIPVLMPIAAFIFYREDISFKIILGILISFLGVLLVVVKGDFSLAAPANGIFFLCAAVTISIAYNVCLKRLLATYNVYTIITILNIISLIYFIPIFLTSGLDEIQHTDFTFGLLSNLLALSFFASTLAFLFYAKGIQILGLTVTNLFANCIPVFVTIFAWYFLKEQITTQMIIGIALVICGLLIPNARSMQNLWRKAKIAKGKRTSNFYAF